MTEKIVANEFLSAIISDYDQARKARAAWEATEKEYKRAILDALGYDPDDPKPQGLRVETEAGDEVFTIATGTWRGLNQKYLKEHHPAVYAECESSKTTVKITYPPF